MSINKRFAKIFIIASNPITTEGLATILKSKLGTDLSIITTLGGPYKLRGIFKIIKKNNPKIVFISEDIISLDTTQHIPTKTNPFLLCRKIKETISDAKILIFSTVNSCQSHSTSHTSYENPLYESIKCGADGYLDATASFQEIINATEALLRGDVYLPTDYAAQLMKSIQKNPYETTPLKNLSPQEIKVLKLIARGFSNKKIARKLHLSNHTIKNHISSLMSKLGARSRTNAVAIAINKGFNPF